MVYTPFRDMEKHGMDAREWRNTVTFFSASLSKRHVMLKAMFGLVGSEVCG